MLFVPDGLVGLVQRTAKSLRERGLAQRLPRARWLSVAGGLLLTAPPCSRWNCCNACSRDYRVAAGHQTFPMLAGPAIVFGQD